MPSVPRHLPFPRSSLFISLHPHTGSRKTLPALNPNHAQFLVALN